MKSPICELLGIEFPLFAFSHCRDVVAAVSRAGGFGVFGASRTSLGTAPQTPESVEEELRWIDDHVGDKPYGVDLLVPENLSTKGEQGVSYQSLQARIPEQHKQFARTLLAKYGVEVDYDFSAEGEPQPYDHGRAMAIMNVAVKHPKVRLLANALGIAPPEMIELGRQHKIPVAALIGSKEHAIRQVKAGVDILVAQGTEAGGHCGEVSTLVLVPEVLQAIREFSSVPVLAAGGIMTGRQMAGCMAMGAAGAWTGSVWLTTVEAETSMAVREKLLAASSRDTVRSRSRSGKPARQLRTAWTEAWDAADSPGALPMPLQTMISTPAYRAFDKSVEAGNARASELVGYIVGQGVGLVHSTMSSASVVQQFKMDFAEAFEDLKTLVEE